MGTPHLGGGATGYGNLNRLISAGGRAQFASVCGVVETNLLLFKELLALYFIGLEA